MRVRVVLALPSHARQVTVSVPDGTSAGAVLQQALREGLSLEGSGLEAERVALGVFGRRIDADAPLHDRDRLELYRPLQQDPMARRRREARRTPVERQPGEGGRAPDKRRR